MWLTGDQTVLRDLRSGDRVEAGGPYLIGFPENRSGFKAILTQRLIQAGAAIVKSNFDSTVMSDQNTRINHLVQSLINHGLGLTPFATGGVSHVDYIMDNDQLFLEVQVDQI